MTLSRLLRRSGVAVLNYCDQLGWKPKTIIMAGLGSTHAETYVFREAWPDVRQVGIEPCPEMRLEGFSGELHRVALSDYVGSGTLTWRRRHKDGASLLTIPDSKHSATVPVTTLDMLKATNDWGRELLLWLDCEGMELRILSEADITLRLTQVVNVELTSSRESRCSNPNDWADPVEVHSLLCDSGFVRLAAHTIRDSIGQVDAIYVRRSLLDRLGKWGLVQCPCQMKRDGCDC